MLSEILFGITIVSFVIIFLLVVYARWNYGKLNDLGFPILPPSFILGSSPDLYKKVQHFEDMERAQTYGPIWGYYQGRTPIVFVADPELIRLIYVKDNLYFYDRDEVNFGSPIVNEILDFLPGEKWRLMRTAQTPFFTSRKVKQYSNEIFQTGMDKFISKLDAEIVASGIHRTKIDTRMRFCTYTIDAIARSMLSMEVEPDRDHQFYTACKQIIGEGQIINQFYVWTLAFPFLSNLAPTLVLDEVMTNTFWNIINSRLVSGITYGDYGDVMVDCVKNLSTPIYQELKITKTTILGQGVNLFLAGFDRISSHITFLAYHLAKEPEIQEKLYDEIQTIFNSNGENFDYNSLQKMTFLNACMLEISRLYPVLIRPERICTKDWSDTERGIKIPKGVIVMIASWAVNRNPEHYENPNKFIPERFLSGNKTNLNPYTFTTFGFGQRSCIGMKFAYEALRVSMARILFRYKFEMRDDTELKFKPGLNFILQFYPVYLDVVKR